MTVMTLPSYRHTQTDFNLMTVDAYNALVSGQGHGTELAYPYWDATVNVVAMQNLEHGYWDAFFKKCRGSKVPFLMYDANRPCPISYTEGSVIGMPKAVGGSFPGYGDVVTFVDVNNIAVEGLPASFKLISGDYVSVVQDDNYSLHQVVADATSDGTGQVTINVEPYVITDLYSAGAQVWVYHPCGKFLLKQGTQPTRTRGLEAMPASFEAISVAF